MTVNISAQTQALLREQAERTGEREDALADTLLLQALQAAGADYEQTCHAIAAGLADVDAGRTVSWEEARALWERRKAARAAEAPLPT